MNSKTTRPIVFSIIFTLICGCTSFKTLNQKRFTVDLSSLDWVQFSRTINGKGDVAPVTVRLQLAGSGYLEYKSGRSTKVTTDFWQDTSASNWHDIHTDYIVLSKEETLKYYQRLVDAGVYDRIKQTKNETEGANLAILARIEFEKKLILTGDPVFIKIFDELLAKF